MKAGGKREGGKIREKEGMMEEWNNGKNIANGNANCKMINAARAQVASSKECETGVRLEY